MHIYIYIYIYIVGSVTEKSEYFKIKKCTRQFDVKIFIYLQHVFLISYIFFRK